MNFTLRYHKTSVTSLCILRLVQEKVPRLISGDTEGKVVIWNLITRRPVTRYDIGKRVNIMSIEQIDDRLIGVLCKDYMLRILRVGQEEEMQEVWSIPVNTLNFANFQMGKLQDNGGNEYMLVCCNTQESENFDVYRVRLGEGEGGNRLQRVCHNVNVYEKLQENGYALQLNDLNKSGIIMKFVLDNNKGVVYCGTESGIIAGFGLPKAAGQDSGTVVYVNQGFSPEPVLDMCLDEGEDCLYGVSTGNAVKKFDVMEGTTRSIEVNRGGRLGQLSVLQEYILVGSWKGESIVISKKSGKVNASAKQRSNLVVSVSSNGQDKSRKFERNTKISSIVGLDRFEYEHGEHHRITETMRIDKFASKDWMIIGYDDGSIVLRCVNSPSIKRV
ncbi:hypothetical protein TBLA_0F03180 [Henningerozyma blattae CBS 6284]|uniref:ASTRA-associated protein 1 n=1 Tax=Henningerozyma blattae (strain ATCC 34711 / CBS 6284 / DSM 70876 / NBRC 10599 / NRRL Y-10934 / UCD 77-7) TaxID=1071380 RepID=I2H654_HENB6|nr:hypothetical protein TBLA_0F03180 [Tetrapisispora blattae CBS 6284]CCH61856.1 hypothetical protein TBLA_0F03180 [Tetrapisispora blattae CBS 6284]